MLLGVLLRVELERFAEEVAARLGVSECYVAPQGVGSVATAADVNKGVVIVATSSQSSAEAEQVLRGRGLTVHRGGWDLDADIGPEDVCRDAWIAGVAYRTGEPKPGLWLDAYPHQPTPAEVLTRLYNEFTETGQIDRVSFEEFIRLAAPNVVVVGPEEVSRYAERNAATTDCPPEAEAPA